MDKRDLEQLVELTNKLDEGGHTQEAAALDSLLIKVAEGDKEMSNKAMNALRSLHKACESFCSKNLDSRGANRRKLNNVCDLAEDLCAEIEPLLK